MFYGNRGSKLGQSINRFEKLYQWEIRNFIPHLNYLIRKKALASIYLSQSPMKYLLCQMIVPTPVTSISMASQSFRFLHLPAELRCMVYKMALPQQVGIASNPFSGQKKKEEIGLLYTCRQVRDESRHILYRTSMFHISLDNCFSFLDFLEWIRTIGEYQVSKIQELRIHVWVEVHRSPYGITYRNQRYDVRPRRDAKSATYHCTPSLGNSPGQRKFKLLHTIRQSRQDHSTALGHLTKVLDKLSTGKQHFGRFCRADVNSIVDTLYLYSTLRTSEPCSSKFASALKINWVGLLNHRYMSISPLCHALGIDWGCFIFFLSGSQQSLLKTFLRYCQRVGWRPGPTYQPRETDPLEAGLNLQHQFASPDLKPSNSW